MKIRSFLFHFIFLIVFSAASWADVISSALGELDPENAGFYANNAEISTGKLAELIEEVNEHEVPAIFVGNTSGEMVQELAKVLKSEVDHPLEILTIMTGSLADEEPGVNYLSFIRYNINQIAKGMGSDS
ncbi:hypothetical protein EXM22_13990 [Oceanispirochaeta crateris]|uniref:Periplasmic binding protein domain-containing protein n=1 Tax=Oceanispirochaeta crateris TaxID=2518645 RepID=A0A5C1QR59_9SPIO|nr:zinc ABC transporter substrate-binding protein [Oceanispirochaeta crateris]QEN09046.1 hypothetical protein EXM22_13990 [Oceanispirochaeta crateris]